MKKILAIVLFNLVLWTPCWATDTFKILAQVNPSAATLTTAYTVPGSTSAVISSIVVTNRSATPTSFRISFQVAAAGDDNKQYIAYDVPIGANQVISFQLGIGLAATDVVKVYATLATVSFNLFGMEIS